MRQRGGDTLTSVFKAEHESLATIEQRIADGATIYADDATGWDALHARYLTKRINHSHAYSDNGACTNQAESFFSRLRRAEMRKAARQGDLSMIEPRNRCNQFTRSILLLNLFSVKPVPLFLKEQRL